MKSTYVLGCGKVKTLLTDILCIDFGFGWWSVWAAYSFQVPNKTQWHTKHHSLRHQGHKGWDLRHSLITASRRIALDWLRFSLEAKCMDRICRYVKLYRNGVVIRGVLWQEMLMENNCESRWFLLTQDKILPVFSSQDNRPWKKELLQINFLLLLKRHWTVWQNWHRGKTDLISFGAFSFDGRCVGFTKDTYLSTCFCVSPLFLDFSSQVLKHSEGQDR